MGDRMTRRGVPLTEEHKQKIRRWQAAHSNPWTGRTWDSLGREHPFRGRQHSRESKEKMRLAKLGRKVGSRLSTEEQEAKAEALSKGERWYFFQRPCKRGHTTKRSVATGHCYTCERTYVQAQYSRRAVAEPDLMLYRSARQRARTENACFELTREDIRTVWPADGMCPILGFPLRHQGVTSEYSPSLDRIDPKLGYIPGNVAVISYQANRIKQRVTDPSVFERLAAWMENPDSSIVGPEYHVCTGSVTRCSCGRMRETARSTARKNGLPFGITVEDIRSAWPKDNKCPIFGVDLHQNSTKGPSAASPSLDKLIPELGYVPGNIAVISHLANRMKSNVTNPVVFRRLAVWMQGQLVGEIR